MSEPLPFYIPSLTKKVRLWYAFVTSIANWSPIPYYELSLSKNISSFENFY